MVNDCNYDDIRPYRDSELKEGMKRAVASPELDKVLAFLFPNTNLEEYKQYLLSMNSVHEFQQKVIAKFLMDLVDKTGNGMEINGLEGLDRDKRYLYISNHRDIVLDAALLDTLMIYNGMHAAENAIGDNLCSRPWITEMMKLNRNFIVKRSGTKREIFDASRKLSSYIRENIENAVSSIWIAQREGRAKDSNDRTQESLLKMLSMSSGKDIKQGFVNLNITPVSISYEYDACDFLKAKEFQQKRDNPDFQKSKDDDVLSMQTGMMGYKGHIHYEVCEPLTYKLDAALTSDADRQTVIETVAEMIDKAIHSHYMLYPGNYVAYDEAEGTTKYLGVKYTEEQKATFDAYVAKQIAKIDLPNKDEAFLREKMLMMYSNLVRNYLKATEE
ncbi:MAG: 1-acyl-sn-glycerol-3-phosphate acyltransferase [Paludibacteraceae bacterium]|nr:1-acyl-sn-glycerol-3-phosphate acyltransferase [Paludibacteraceae bacterium]